VVGSRDKLEALDAAGNVLWSAPSSTRIGEVAAGVRNGEQPAVIAASASGFRGGLTLWNGEGAPLASPETAAGVSALELLDLDGDGAVEVVYGMRPMEPFVVASSVDGEALWSRYLGAQTVRVLEAELDGDAGRELLACADELYALDGDGELLWRQPALYTTYVAAMPAGENGGGKVFAGSSTLKCYTETGEVLWESDVPAVNDLALAQLDGDDELEIVVGCKDNVILAMQPDGTAIWQRETGWMEVRVAAAQLDDDPAHEVVATDGAQYYAFESDGGELWSERPSFDGKFYATSGLSVGNLAGGEVDQIFLWHRLGFAVLSARGALLRNQLIGAEPREVQVRSLGNDKPGEVFALLEDSLHVYAPDGTLRRTLGDVAERQSRPRYVRGTGLLFCDLDGGGEDEVLVGLGCLEALSPAGEPGWPNACRCGPTVLARGDLDGDRGKEIVCATRGIAVTDDRGALRCTWPSATQTSSLAVADLDGDGIDEVVAGGFGPTVLGFSKKRGAR